MVKKMAVLAAASILLSGCARPMCIEFMRGGFAAGESSEGRIFFASVAGLYCKGVIVDQLLAPDVSAQQK